MRDLPFSAHRPYELTLEFVMPNGRLMEEELVWREKSNRLDVLSTVIFLRQLTKRFDESAYINFSDRLGKDWLPYYQGERERGERRRQLSSHKRNLAYYHWKLGKACLHESRNYLPVDRGSRARSVAREHSRQVDDHHRSGRSAYTRRKYGYSVRFLCPST